MWTTLLPKVMRVSIVKKSKMKSIFVFCSCYSKNTMSV